MARVEVQAEIGGTGALDQPQHALTGADPAIGMRLDRDLETRGGGNLASPGKTLDHGFIFTRPIPLRFERRAPLLRDRPLQDRLDLGLKRIGRHAGDDRRADRCCDIHAALVAFEINRRYGSACDTAEGQIEEEVGEHQPLSVSNLLQLADGFGCVIAQHVHRPGGEFKALAARRGEPPQRRLIWRVPIESPNR